MRQFKKILSVLCAAALLCTLSFIPYSVAAESTGQSFTNNSFKTSVTGDPRFSEVMTFADIGTDSYNMTVPDGDTSHSWVVTDLSSYIGTSAAIDSNAVISFWLKADKAFADNSLFFHFFSNNTWNDSSYVYIDYTTANRWQLITIPLSSFTSTNPSQISRFVFRFAENAFEGTCTVMISPAVVYTETPDMSGLHEADTIELDEAELYLKKYEMTTLTPSVSSSEYDTGVYPCDIIWSSDNTEVAVVDQNGRVTACGEGKATVKAASLSDDSVYVTCDVFVEGVLTCETVASYKLNSIAQTVENDPRFNTVYNVSVANDTTAFFYNGENDWAHADLSDYINQSTAGVVSFYVKSSKTGTAKLYFFHTANGEYMATNTVSFTIDKADKWIAVNIPTDKIKYGGTTCIFGRLDLQIGGLELGENDYFTVSPINVMTMQPEPYYDADNIIMSETEKTVKVNEKTKLDVTFTSSVTGSSERVIPFDIIWKSENNEVVSVNEYGYITGTGEGTATVTAACASDDTVAASCLVTVSGTLLSETVASYKLNSIAQAVENDPRFNTVYNVPVATDTTAFYYNGENDWAHADLSGYINRVSSGVVSFYVKSSKTGTAKLYFFHTANGEYMATNVVTFTIDTADKWIAVNIPTDMIKYGGTTCIFGRLDLQIGGLGLGENDYFTVSPINVMTMQPEPYYDADTVMLSETEKTMKIDEIAKLEAVFTSSEGKNAIPFDVTWKTSDAGVVTVESKGVVKAAASGEADISLIRSSDGSVQATCHITVSGTLEIEELGRFWLDSAAQAVSGDARFGEVYSFSGQDRIELCNNGTNDWSDHLDFTDYLGKTSNAVISFYVKSAKVGSYKVCLFHTNSAEYMDTSYQYFTVEKADTWQLVNIPLGGFEYYGAKSKIFAKLAIYAGNNDITVSAARALTKAPVDLTTLDGELSGDGLTAETVLISAQDAAVIQKEDKTEVTSGSVGTGMVLGVSDNGEFVHYAVFVVKNDLNGNGKTDAGDIILLKKQLLGVEQLSSAQIHAVSENGRLSIIDLIRLKKSMADTVS